MPNIPKVIILIENSRGFGRELLRGIAKYCRLRQPWNFYRIPAFFLDPHARLRQQELKRMKQWGATGIIMREIENIEDIIAFNLPTIVSTYSKKEIQNVCSIKINNHAIGVMAAEHFLEIGFKNFAFCGLDDFFWSHERREGFTERLSGEGYKAHIFEQSKKANQLWDAEQITLGNWLSALPKPVGVMACVDERSQDIIETCKTVDIKIPEEVAVIGAENDELICTLANPALSSVAINGVRAGYQAAELLDALMSGEKKMRQQAIIVEPTHIEVRQSTQTFGIADIEVAKAINFIKLHCRELIQVSDVVNVTNYGRRGLEKKFQRLLRRSIHDEIRKARIELIAKMLRETSKTISEIAESVGWLSVNNIARYFKQEKGISLLEYRKKYGF